MIEPAIRVAKHCPNCKRRLFDKISLSSGFVEIKCPECGHVYRFNLSMRRAGPSARVFPRAGNW